MRKEDCFYLGKIAKNLVSKGSSCLFRHGRTWVIQNLESVFECNKHLVPFIESSSLHKNDFLRIRFEDMNTEEDRCGIGNDLYLPLNMLPKLTGNKFYFTEVMVLRSKTKD
jgi:16S rRNA processing protein RimM